MRCRTKLKVFAMLTAASLMGVAGTRAYVINQISVENHIRMGDVDISLKEYELAGGKEIPYADDKEILPGDSISKIPRIRNEAEPCWVRARVLIRNEGREAEGLSEKQLTGISSKWVRRGEYYYYTEAVRSEQSVDLFHRVSIPEEWDSRYSGNKIYIEIQAEAVQAEHFTPDFQAMSPWGNQKVELCIHEENNRIKKRTEHIQHRVELSGKANRLLAVSDDFFSNLGTAMPGDTLTDFAYVNNTTAHPAVLYFHTGLSELDDKQSALLSALKMELYLKGKQIYSGGLAAEDLQKERELITLQPGEEEKLEFRLVVPESLGNTYALKDTSVQWFFRAEEKGVTATPSVTPAPEEKESDPVLQEEQNSMETVRTGDAAWIFCYEILLVFSGITAIRMIFELKKGRDSN